MFLDSGLYFSVIHDDLFQLEVNKNIYNKRFKQWENFHLMVSLKLKDIIMPHEKN